MLDVTQTERDAIGAAADMVVRVLAKHHDFRLPVSDPAEGNRLLGFLETIQRDDYTEFDTWSSVMFTAAVGTARILVSRQLQRN